MDTVTKAEANDHDLLAARRMAADAQHAARRRADTIRRIRELCTDRHSRVLGTEARGWRWYVDVDDVLRILQGGDPS